MTTHTRINRWRVRARAARTILLLCLPGALFAGLFFLFFRFKSLSDWRRDHWRYGALSFVSVTVSLSFLFAAEFLEKTRVKRLTRTSIAGAPLGVKVAVGGRVGRASDAPELSAPISGSPCVYYRIQLEHSAKDKLSRVAASLAAPLASSERLVRFVVADESGFVLVDPGADVEALPDDTDSPRVAVLSVYVELSPRVAPGASAADVELSPQVAVYTSVAGCRGLPPVAQTYLETVRKRLPERDFARLMDMETTRVRLTEVILREGDIVSVTGNMEERQEPGAYRESRLRAMSHPCTVNLAGPDELAWLDRFDRRFAAVLWAVAVAGMLAFLYGFFMMLSRWHR